MKKLLLTAFLAAAGLSAQDATKPVEQIEATAPEATKADFFKALANSDLPAIKAIVEQTDKEALRWRFANNNTPLIIAAARGHAEGVTYLLDMDAEPDAANDDGNTALIAAARMGHKNVMKTLIDKGANINARNNNGVTPLISAVLSKNSHAAVCTLLAKKDQLKIDATLPESNATALHLAILIGHTDAAEEIAEAGADVNATFIVSTPDRTISGHTALMLAVANDDTYLATYLIKKGAKVDVKNEIGETPRSLAKNKSPAMIKLLEENTPPTPTPKAMKP